MSATPADYRPDVDGMRAVAVAAVVAYHVAPSAVPGGFVGVDIFFVISGYLISRLIVADLAAERFSYATFYLRRARRIFPALALVLATTLAAGWFVLLPDEWRELGTDTLAGAAFSSNLVLLSVDDGYFARDADERVLLHLWSLGVEEQFYFVWPFLLVMIWRARAAIRPIVILIIIAVSFGLNVLIVDRFPSFAFYLPVTRLWQLATGSLLCIAENSRSSESFARWRAPAGVAGLALCLCGVLFIRDASRYPGYQALLPTLGAALLIAAGREGPVNRLLSWRPIVALGLISYPLYLWHWPLLSLTRIVTGAELSVLAAAVCVAVSLSLAFATTRLLENRVRRSPARSRAVRLAIAVVAMTAFAGAIVAAGGVRGRLDDWRIHDLIKASGNLKYPFHGGNLNRHANFVRFDWTGQVRGRVLFIGDSHVEHYWPRIAKVMREQRTHDVSFMTKPACPPASFARLRRAKSCAAFLKAALAEASGPETVRVVFGSSWVAYLGSLSPEEQRVGLTSFSRQIRVFRNGGKDVVVILQSPKTPELHPRKIIGRVNRASGAIVRPQPVPVGELFSAPAAASLSALRAAAEQGGARIVDPLPVLCPRGLCPVVAPDGDPIYGDAEHLRPRHAEALATFIDPLLLPVD